MNSIALDLQGVDPLGPSAVGEIPPNIPATNSPASPQTPLSVTQPSIRVQANSETPVPDSLAQHAEALDHSIVDAYLISPGSIGIPGAWPDRTGPAITGNGVLTWPVRVIPATTLRIGSGSAPAGSTQLFYPSPPLSVPGGAQAVAMPCQDPLPATPSAILAVCSPSAAPGIWGQTFQQGAVSSELTSTGEYRVDVNPKGGIHVTAASLLETPLLDFGVAPTWGIDARAPWGLEAIGTPLGVQLLQHVPVSNQDIFAGFTPLGPLGGIQFSSGAFSARTTALLSTGQVQTAESISLRDGDVSLSYYTGPTANGVIARLTRQPLDFIVSAGSAGPQVGLACTMGEGRTLQVQWSSASGFQVGFTGSLGER